MQNKYEAMMMLTCDPGYFYKGQRVIRCQANGTWDYPEPRPSCESECNIGYSDIDICFATTVFSNQDFFFFWETCDLTEDKQFVEWMDGFSNFKLKPLIQCVMI